jgi:hypothetical protein
MAATSQQYPRCQQTLPTDVHICLHCSISLYMPDYPGRAATRARSDAPPGVVQTDTSPDAIQPATTSLTIAGRALAGPLFNPLLLITLLLSARVFDPAGDPITLRQPFACVLQRAQQSLLAIR